MTASGDAAILLDHLPQSADRHLGNLPDLFRVVNDQPVDRLGIAAGRGETGDIQQLGKRLAGHGFVREVPDGPAAAHQLPNLFRRDP